MKKEILAFIFVLVLVGIVGANLGIVLQKRSNNNNLYENIDEAIKRNGTFTMRTGSISVTCYFTPETKKKYECEVYADQFCRLESEMTYNGAYGFYCHD